MTISLDSAAPFFDNNPIAVQHFGPIADNNAIAIQPFMHESIRHLKIWPSEKAWPLNAKQHSVSC